MLIFILQLHYEQPLHFNHYHQSSLGNLGVYVTETTCTHRSVYSQHYLAVTLFIGDINATV